MFKKRVLFFLLMMVFVLSSCDVFDPEKIKERRHLPDDNFVADENKGKSLFRDACSQCHGNEGMGSDRGPPLVHKIYRPGHHADLSFHWAVKDGSRQHHWRFGNMPPIENVSPDEVGHIIAYIRSEQRKKGIQ